jgi:DNA-binding NtrC family response regulator
MSRRILVLSTPDDDLAMLTQAFKAVPERGCRVETVADADDLIRRLTAGPPCDLVAVDYLLGDGRQRGSDVLAAIRHADPDVPIVAVAEKGDVELAAEAVRAGATDFLVRGGQLEARVTTLLGKVRRLLDLMDRNRRLREQNRLLRLAERRRHHIVGQSPQIRQVLQRIYRVAAVPRPVLIRGERGTGKELVARAIHAASDRSAGPFVVVNCAAFPDTLLESELFGHEKGAFTGAERQARGKFEQADGGTLFLDEISHMSLPFQQKVLRAVEYGTFTRVGGASEIQVDVRIIAATNADLKAAIAAGRFLADLGDRLAFEEILLPPLRQRQGDVEILAQHFLTEFMREIPALGGKRLGAKALEVLRRYEMPGNVRELKNLIERAAYRGTANEIMPEDIGLEPGPAAGGPGGTFQERVEAFRGGLIRQALQEAAGNRARAARLLGLSYHQFRYYHRKYGAAGCGPRVA